MIDEGMHEWVLEDMKAMRHERDNRNKRSFNDSAGALSPHDRLADFNTRYRQMRAALNASGAESTFRRFDDSQLVNFQTTRSQSSMKQTTGGMGRGGGQSQTLSPTTHRRGESRKIQSSRSAPTSLNPGHRPATAPERVAAPVEQAPLAVAPLAVANSDSTPGGARAASSSMASDPSAEDAAPSIEQFLSPAMKNYMRKHDTAKTGRLPEVCQS